MKPVQDVSPQPGPRGPQNPDAAPGSLPTVGIVVINYNGVTHTDTCLTSLAALDYPAAQIILVDNGSTDDSLARLRALHPEQDVIVLPHNVGFTAANNVGTREALRRGLEFVWFLNNDTTVAPGALRALVDAAVREPQLGAVSSVLYDMRQPERIQGWGGGWVDLWRGQAELFDSPVDPSRLDFLSGTSLLVRREPLEALNLLDERYFMYWEDADFSFRLRRAGWQLGVAGDAHVWHLGAASMGLSTLNHKSLAWELNFTRSGVRFFLRHAPFPPAPLLAGPGFYLLKRVLRGQWSRAAAVARGGWLAFRGAVR